MASAITLPQAPNSGLSTLGQILLGGATDYAQNKRADDREARLRAQRLADVADERTYARTENDRTYDRARTDRLADVRDERQYSELEKNDAMARELVRLGYLSPGDLRNASAIAAAYARVQEDGTARRYEEALKTGDLTYADLGDAERVASGLERFSARLAQRTTDQDASRQSASARSNILASEEQQLATRLNQLESRLSEPAPRIDPQSVRALALQRATQSIPKAGWLSSQRTVPSEAEIAAQIPQAQDDLTAQAFATWNQDKEDAKIQASILARRLSDLRAEQNTIVGRFGVVGSAPSAPVSSPTASAPAAPRPDLAAAQKAFVDALMGKSGKAPSGATPASPGPTMDATLGRLQDIGLIERPIVQQGRVRVFAPTTPEFVQQARGRLQEEIARVETPAPARPGDSRLQELQTAQSKQLRSLLAALDALEPPPQLGGGLPVSGARVVPPFSTATETPAQRVARPSVRPAFDF